MLPFICYQETNRDTYIVGTEGKDLLAYYWPVHLGPATPIEGIEVDDCNVAFLAENPMFNFSLAQALKNLNDPSTLVEVSHFCILSHQINTMQGCGYYLEQLYNHIQELQKELTVETRYSLLMWKQ
jgi:hypothetical protein